MEENQEVHFFFISSIINTTYLFISQNLSQELEQKVVDIFKKFDTDGSKSIDKDESASYWYYIILPFFNFK